MDERSDLLAQIKKGKELRKVHIDCNNPRSANEVVIFCFIQVDGADRVQKRSKKTGGDNVADILEKVINQRFDVFQDSTDSDFDEEDDSDSDGWSD